MIIYYLNKKMKTFLILIVFSLTISEIKSARWVKVWSDEFDGGTVGASWNFEIGNNNGWSNNELQYYTNSNHVVKDGLLTIEARKEPNSGF
jgi:beta-glucanase (GH16 family)